MVLAVVFWLLAGTPGRARLRMMRSFIWLAPGLVLMNALFGPAPRIGGVLSRDGLSLGLLITLRLGWAAWMAIVLIRSCSPRDLLESFRAILRLLRIPDRNISTTLFLTLEILPQFADIHAGDFRNLPRAIASRLSKVVLPALMPGPCNPGRVRLRPADMIILFPAIGLLVLAALV